MVARYLQKLSRLTPSDRRDNFCKYRATMKFLAPFLKEMDFSVLGILLGPTLYSPMAQKEAFSSAKLMSTGKYHLS